MDNIHVCRMNSLLIFTKVVNKKYYEQAKDLAYQSPINRAIS